MLGQRHKFRPAGKNIMFFFLLYKGETTDFSMLWWITESKNSDGHENDRFLYSEIWGTCSDWIPVNYEAYFESKD